MDVKKILESQIGSVTPEEFEYAIEQFELNCEKAGHRKLFDATALDILATNVDYVRRLKFIPKKSKERGT